MANEARGVKEAMGTRPAGRQAGDLPTDPVPTGETWAAAFTTVQQGIDAASAGDEVWVAAATYPENVLLKDGVALYGGFKGGETNLVERNWTNHVTILDGRQTNSVVIVQAGATHTTRIDGFRLQKENAVYGGGILCTNSPCIDAGDDSVVQPGWLDLDGLPRILGQHVDIGAYETVQAGDWLPFPATKGMVQVTVVTVGGITYGQYTITFPDSCFRLAEIAPLVVNGQAFSRDFKIEHQTGVACAEIVSVQKGAFVVGRLAPGDYTFTTLSWGGFVENIPFAVPASTTPTLHSVILNADGRLRMLLEGIPAIDYVLQASTNLVGWTSISTNQTGSLVLPAPDAQLFDRRFYRVQIGQ